MSENHQVSIFSFLCVAKNIIKDLYFIDRL
jgi:hypothetical protein